MIQLNFACSEGNFPDHVRPIPASPMHSNLQVPLARLRGIRH